MANIKTGNPWVLDTAEVVVATGTSVRVKALRFVGAADIDDCILHNGAGVEVWRAKLGDVSVNGYESESYFGDRGIVIDGMDLATITGGILFVYLAGSR